MEKQTVKTLTILPSVLSLSFFFVMASTIERGKQNTIIAAQYAKPIRTPK
jgi:hypothetical protein